MFYILAFVIGGCARSARWAGVFGTLYVVLYAAALFAGSAEALRTGTTSVAYILQHLALYGAIAVAIICVGYLCRVVIGDRLARSAD